MKDAFFSPTEKTEGVELSKLKLKKIFQESQVYLGAGGRQEWYHVIFDNKKTAEACAQEIQKDGIAAKAPKVYAKDPVYQARYPEGTYFFRVHHSAFAQFKEKYEITKKVLVYGAEDKPVTTKMEKREENNGCRIS